MEKTRIPYACTLLVLSAACDSEVLTTSTAQALTQTVCSGGLCYEVADPIHDDEKCPGDRYIGYTSSSSCPVAGSSWTTSHLFEGSSGELARFCLYTWPSGSAPVPGELPVIPRAKDCPVVTPLSPSLNSPLSREAVLEDAFLDQVEAFGSLQAAVDPIPVAVIDAGPAAAPPLWTEGRIAHPRALQLLIHRLACPQNGALGQLCAADPYSFLALPRYREPSGAIGYDVVDGGEFGYQSDLAIAIFEAARDLRQPQGPQAILNLSVGWHPGAAGPGTPGSFSPPVDAVYRALQYASCHEHLIFAAAGNTTGGAHVAPSAFLPGAWTTLPSPAPTDCRTLFGLRPTAPPLGIPHPLVHATAGLDSQDDMLHNAVPGARPRLLAAGSYSVVEDRVSPAAGDYTPPLTGSSISTAVLSAAAAVVWSLRPHLTAPEVAEAVYASGHPTFMATELHLGRAGLAHRVSMCGSAEDACLLRGSCSVACVRQGGKRDLRPRLPPLTASDVASALNINDLREVGYPCFGRALVEPLTTHADPCPRDQFPDTALAPSVLPLPDGPVCSVCEVLQNKAVLNLSDPLPGTLSSPVLSLTDASGQVTQVVLDIPSHDLQAGAVIEVADLLANSTDKASISFIVDQNSSTADPMLVAP